MAAGKTRSLGKILWMWPARTGSPRASDSLAQQASLPIRTFRKVDWMWRGWIRRDLACWAALLAWPAAANPIAPDRLGHASASAWRELPQYFKTTRPVTRHGSPRLSEIWKWKGCLPIHQEPGKRTCNEVYGAAAIASLRGEL